MKIERIVDLPDLGHEVEIDDYVPFSFSLVWPFQGRPRYARYYPEDDAPLQLTLVESEPIVRSVVLLSMKRTCSATTGAPSTRTVGAPVLDIDYPPPNDDPGSFALDIPTSYATAIGDDFIECHVGDMAAADECIVSGPLVYYVKERELVGMRCDGLSEQQVETLHWHATRGDPA